MMPVMVAQSDAIAPIAFEINVQPYSPFTVRDRTLSPTAAMLYEQILREI